MEVLLPVMCLQISAVLSMPLLHLLQPYPRLSVQPQQNLQKQLLELQTIDQLSQMNRPSPVLIFLPDQKIDANGNTNQRIQDRIQELIKHDPQTDADVNDLDSVVVDAEPVPILEEQKAVLLVPGGRFSIGGIISAIPFLPIEINVPDTISWAYNGIAEGIASIISIIGSRLPQRPSQETTTKGVNLKSIINEMQLKNLNRQRPFVILPLNGLSRTIMPLQL